MSYAVSAALQAAIYQHLAADTDLAAIVGTAVFDTVPTGTAPDLYVSLGPEEVKDASDMTGRGAVHTFTVSVVNDGGGFQAAKEAAGAVSDALSDAALSLSRGSLVGIRFLRATAKRTEKGSGRQIDLRFRARVEDAA